MSGSKIAMSAERSLVNAGESDALADRLRDLVSGRVEQDVDLREYAWWRIGGRGLILVEPSNALEVQACLSFLDREGITRLVIGDGSNLLFDDAGFNGVLIRIGRNLSDFSVQGTHVRVGAGMWVPDFVRRLGQAGLSGLEHAIGIPGTVGGLVIMNGGSQRKGVGQHITVVKGCDCAGLPFVRDATACNFRYRGSTLQDDELIVLEAQFELTPRARDEQRREMIAILADRRRKFPKNLPNCGSVFLSNPAMYSIVGPPGAAIERVGLKGLREGDAQISPLHANFIVNLGNARSQDVLHLIHRARQAVFDATGFHMDCEVRHVSPDGVVSPAHVVAEQQS